MADAKAALIPPLPAGSTLLTGSSAGASSAGSAGGMGLGFGFLSKNKMAKFVAYKNMIDASQHDQSFGWLQPGQGDILAAGNPVIKEEDDDVLAKGQPVLKEEGNFHLAQSTAADEAVNKDPKAKKKKAIEGLSLWKL